MKSGSASKMVCGLIVGLMTATASKASDVEVVAASGVTTALGPNLTSGAPFEHVYNGVAIPGSEGLGALAAPMQFGFPPSGVFRVGSPSGPVALAAYGQSGALGPADPAYMTYSSICGFASCIAPVGIGAVAFQAGAFEASGVWIHDAMGNAPSLVAPALPATPVETPCVSFEVGQFMPIRSNQFGFALARGRCSLSVGGSRDGLWVKDADGWHLKVLFGSDGQYGPGLGNGTTFITPTNFDGAALTEEGGVVLVGTTNTGFAGIWRSVAGNNQALALSSMSDGLGPGLGASITFKSFRDSIAIGVAPLTIAFVAELQGAGVTTNSRWGVFLHRNGANVAVARTGVSGSLGPGLGPADVFLNFEGHIGKTSLDVNGDTVGFLAQASTNQGSVRGVWHASTDGVSAQLLSGTDSILGPQLGAGITFSTFSNVEYLQNGELVAEASTNEPSANQGLWNVSPGRLPLVLFRTGGIVDVDPGQGLSPRIIANAATQAPAFGSRGSGWPAHVADDGFAIFPVFFAGTEQETGLVRIQLRDLLFTSGME